MITSRISPPADQVLVARVAAGDVRAFEVIYDRHCDQAFALAMHVTSSRRGAEEVTQDAFLSFWRVSGSYDASRGTLKSWLLAVVRNRSIDWLRREARHGRTVELDEVLSERLEAGDRTEDEVIRRDASAQARQLVADLPAEQRQVIELSYFKGLTQREIAARVRIPLGTVKGRQRLALTKLHQALIGQPKVATMGGRPAHLIASSVPCP